MPAAETHWSPRLQYSIPFSHADCEAGILWPESLYYRTDGFLGECVHQKPIQKNNWQPFFKSKLQIVYNLCACYFTTYSIYWDDCFCFVFFLPNLFGCRFCIKTALQLSRAPTKLHGAERFEERSATNLLPVPRSLRSQLKERNGLGKSPCWELPEKKGKVFGHFFPTNSSHPTFVFSRFFIGGLVESGMESLYEMNTFRMPAKHEVATTNEALEGSATQNFSRFITRTVILSPKTKREKRSFPFGDRKTILPFGFWASFSSVDSWGVKIIDCTKNFHSPFLLFSRFVGQGGLGISLWSSWLTTIVLIVASVWLLRCAFSQKKW